MQSVEGLGADMSVDCYVGLEQARDPIPAVLDALARALRLGDVEREHLYSLVGPDREARRRTSTMLRGERHGTRVHRDLPSRRARAMSAAGSQVV